MTVCKRFARVVATACVFGALAQSVSAQQGVNCSATSIGRTPLTDLGANLYNGHVGGLYPNGSNVRPAGHESAGLLMASGIQPLNSLGQVDAANGQIGFVSIGMSNTNSEFEVFEHLANVDVNRNPRVTLVNGAQGGQTAFQWADPNHAAWTTLDTIVSTKGLSNPQVQVAWIKLTVRGLDVGVGGWPYYPPFPATAALLQSKVKTVVQILKVRYPNIKIAYLSSRIFMNYGAFSNYPEPIAYEEGFGIKWLIEDQINGDPALAYTGSNPQAPYLAWGPYLWADGLGSDGVVGGVPGRQDGLEYSCQDFESDGYHPSASGRSKVAQQLLSFVNTDTTSQAWYRNPNPPPVSGTPYYVDLDGVNDYLAVPDSNSLSFINGAADTPLTFETWVRPDTMIVKQNLVSKWLDGLNREYRFYFSSGFVRLDMRDGSTSATVSAYSSSNQSSLVGGWHHLAVTYDGRGGATAANGVTIYVDGVAIPVTRANNPAYVAMENSTVPLQIGRESSSFQQYNGALDELRIWNVARTQNQVQLHMNGELVGTEAGLVAYWKFNEGVGATVADDSPADHAAIMYNNPTWVVGGPMDPPAPDVTSPEISNVIGSNLTDSSVTVTFDTSEVTTGWVSVTPNTSCPCTNVYAPTSSSHHVVNLTGLAPDTFYIFEAKATDAAGNFRVSSTMSFRTLPLPVDSTSPTVSITNPPAGNVTGTVVVTANALDNIGVAGVQFKIDGVNLGVEDNTFPYSVSWDTRTVVDGSHTVTAEARDLSNNRATFSVVVNVANNASGTPYYLDLDGVNDYLAVPDSNSLSFINGAADTPLTFETWVRPDTMIGKQNLVSKWLDGLNREYRFYFASGILRFDMRDGSTSATVSAYSSSNQSSLVGGWHHLAVTYDGRGGATAANGVTIYVDGVAIPVTRANNPAYVAMENSTVPLQIGRESSSFQQYNGALDELRIWNVARTQNQVQLHMNGELVGTEVGLVAYWKFNEGVGTTVADDSPADHAAIMYNNPTWVAGGPPQ